MAMSKDVGYQVILISAVPERYKCSLCKLLLRKAIQTFRGELACESCYKSARRSNPEVCPIDVEPIDDSKIFQDKHLRRKVLKFPCYCNNKDNRCQWQGKVQDVEEHGMACGHFYVSCKSCNQEILAKKICQFCEENFLARDLEVNSERTLEKHLQENLTIPATIAVSVTQTAKEEIERLKHQQRNEFQLRTELQERVEEQNNMYASMKADMLKLQKKLWTVEKEFAEYRALVEEETSNLASEIEKEKQNLHQSLTKPVQDTMGLIDSTYEDLLRKNRNIEKHFL